MVQVPEQLGLTLWQPVGLVAGVDEAGRGPLAGPVVAAAVILDHERPIAGVNDSKKLTPRKREALFDVIRAQSLCFCIAEASAQEIDELNILQATVKGDAKVAAIAAASILAKVHRDRLCLAMHDTHPEYGFATHKGYPTVDHLAALAQHGACNLHRRSFAPVRDALLRAASVKSGAQ